VGWASGAVVGPVAAIRPAKPATEALRDIF
jgi:hypothetical protein